MVGIPNKCDVTGPDLATSVGSAKTTWTLVRPTLSDGTLGFGEATHFGSGLVPDLHVTTPPAATPVASPVGLAGAGADG